ncbi:MAG: hypothetical protein ACJ0IZ_05470 [Verrucomicrobiales bacterium]
MNTENSAVRTALLKGMLKGLEGQTNVDSPEGWALLSAELEKSEIPEHQSLARQIGQIFGDKNASNKALEILKNQDSKLVDRRDSLKSLIAKKIPNYRLFFQCYWMKKVCRSMLSERME